MVLKGEYCAVENRVSCLSGTKVMFFLQKPHILSIFFVCNVIYFYFCARKTQNMVI